MSQQPPYPPQGPNPGQPYPPQGNSVPPSAGYGSPGGSPHYPPHPQGAPPSGAPGGQYAPPPGAPYGQPMPRPKGSVGKLIAIIAVILVIAGVGVGALMFTGGFSSGLGSDVQKFFHDDTYAIVVFDVDTLHSSSLSKALQAAMEENKKHISKDFSMMELEKGFKREYGVDLKKVDRIVMASHDDRNSREVMVMDLKDSMSNGDFEKLIKDKGFADQRFETGDEKIKGTTVYWRKSKFGDAVKQAMCLIDGKRIVRGEFSVIEEALDGSRKIEFSKHLLHAIGNADFSKPLVMVGARNDEGEEKTTKTNPILPRGVNRMFMGGAAFGAEVGSGVLELSISSSVTANIRMFDDSSSPKQVGTMDIDLSSTWITSAVIEMAKQQEKNRNGRNVRPGPRR